MDKIVHGMRWQKTVIGSLCALALLILPSVVFKSQYLLYLSSLACIYMIVSCGLNITLGYAGQISLAQAGFLGIGAYIGALWGSMLGFWVTLPLGGLIAFAFGLGLGFPSLRVKTHFLAMVTIGFSVIVYLFLMNEQQWTGGPYGLFNIKRPSIGPFTFTSPAGYHIIVAVVTFILLFVALWALNSPWGRAFKAIRENEGRAEMLGVNLRNYKLMAFAIGAGYAGVAGGLIGPLMGYIDPTMFSLAFSFQFLLMVVVGGAGRFEGAILGAIIVAILPESLRFAEKYYPIIFALAAILIMVFMPKGCVSFIDWIYKRLTGKEEIQLTK
jgi:branched-chain amino acid transport system permease protein